jgi:hypothetical protein
MRLNDDIREIIEVKYHDGTSNEVLIHLKRNFQVYMVKSDYILKPSKYLVIEGKSHLVYDNKKYLKTKMSQIIKETFEHIEEGVRMKTIKKFLDMVMGLDLS